MSVHFRKDNQTWYAKWREDGKQRSRNFGKGNEARKEAESFDLQVRLRKGIGFDPETLAERSNVVYLDTLTQAWLDFQRNQGKSEQYRVDVKKCVENYFIQEFASTPVDRITLADILRVANEKLDHLSQTTRNRYLSYLKILFNFGREHDLIQTNPMKKWKKCKEKPRKARLTVSDLNKILANSAEHLRWAIEVCFNTGLRPGPTELFAIKWTDVNWDEGYLSVYASKTSSWRNISLSAVFLEKLRQKRAKSSCEFVVSYKGKKINKLRRSLTTACEKAGIGYQVRMYDIRHLYATTLLQRGADLKAVSDMMGHATTQMTVDVYYECHVSEKKRAANLLPELIFEN